MDENSSDEEESHPATVTDTRTDTENSTSQVVNSSGSSTKKAPVGARRRALLRDITREKLIFTLCAHHYESLSLNFSIPTIVITALSGFVSFLGASNLFPPEYRELISLIVGLMATVATILGGLAQQFKYGNRAEAFSAAAQQYGILENKLKFSIRANTGKRMGDSFYQAVETQILDIAKSMKYFPPQTKVKSWTENGLIEQLEDKTPLPNYLKPWAVQLKALGVTDAKDMVFLTQKNIKHMKPRMPEVVIQKVLAAALNEQTSQGYFGANGGIAEGSDLFKALSPTAKKRLSLDHIANISNIKGGTKVTPLND